MPRNPNPLDAHPQVTRPDFKSYRGLTVLHVIRSHAPLRFPPTISEPVREYFHYVREKSWMRMEGQAIAVLFDFYGKKILAHSDFEKVKQLFMDHVDLYGLMEKEEEDKFKKLLMLCFFPLSIDESPPHDDWLMASIEVTLALINEILLSSGNGKNANKLLHWLEDVYKPKRDSAFYFGNWLLYRWIFHHQKIAFSPRDVNLLADPNVLTYDEAKIKEVLSAPLPPSNPPGTETLMRNKNKLATILCPDDVTEVMYGEKKGDKKQQRASVLSVTYCLVDEILLSYVLSRVADDEQKKAFSVQFGNIDHTDFSQKPMGKAMTEYGEAIANSEMYKKVFSKIEDHLNKSSDLFKKHIMLATEPVLYDRVMVVCLLTSEFVNHELKKGDLMAAKQQLYNGAVSLTAPGHRGDIVQEGFFTLAHNYKQIKGRTEFDILSNPAKQNVKANLPPQTIPLINSPNTKAADTASAAAGLLGLSGPTTGLGPVTVSVAAAPGLNPVISVATSSAGTSATVTVSYTTDQQDKPDDDDEGSSKKRQKIS